MPTYKIADVVFTLTAKYGYVTKLCAEYLFNGVETPSFNIQTSTKDIEAEKQNAINQAKIMLEKGETLSNGALPTDFSESYLEALNVYRKLCDYILNEKGGLMLHCSAVALDDKAYLFTAPSGTGKSTHARFWLDVLGNRAVIINDDKPIIRYIDGDFYVYGTPWDGKHRLSTNTRAKVKGICFLSQADKNVIEKVDGGDMLVKLLAQTVVPTKRESADKLLELVDKLIKGVDFYTLQCLPNEQSAKLSISVMTGEKV